MDWQREVADATEFVEGLKLDVFQDQVFVFTPKGDVKDLPAGATPLDFAYRIHTDVGHRTIGAKVNNRWSRSTTACATATSSRSSPPRRRTGLTRLAGDRPDQPGPREDPPMVQAPAARREHRPGAGAARPRAPPPGPRDAGHGRRRPPDRDRAQLHYRELDDFYAAIGYGAVSPAAVVSRLGIHDDVAISLPEVAPPAAPSTAGVRVKGVGDLLVRFANCCSPIPGDEISGYVTRGKGVTVHRATCPSVLSEKDIERLIEVEWEVVAQQTYPITVRIEGVDRPGLLNEITNVVAEAKVNIVAASVGTHPDGTAAITLTLKVTSLQQLSKVLARIEGVRDVTAVTREQH